MTDEKEDILFFMQQLRLDVKRKVITQKQITKELRRIEDLINNNLD